MGLHASTHNGKVECLVLHAPQWLSTDTVPAGAPPLGAYRTVTRDATRARWLMGVPADKQAGLIPPGWFDQWADATFATDPAGAQRTPPVLRAPNGVAQDSRDTWLAGKPLYQPSDIRVPTLLLHAEWDADLPAYQTQACFRQLIHAPYKRWVEIGEGTHTVMLEKNRMQFFHELAGFLKEREPTRTTGEAEWYQPPKVPTADKGIVIASRACGVAWGAARPARAALDYRAEAGSQ